MQINMGMGIDMAMDLTMDLESITKHQKRVKKRGPNSKSCHGITNGIF